MCSPVIVNGVCVRWRGWVDLERLDGLGRIEFDEEAAKVSDSENKFKLKNVKICNKNENQVSARSYRLHKSSKLNRK